MKSTYPGRPTHYQLNPPVRLMRKVQKLFYWQCMQAHGRRQSSRSPTWMDGWNCCTLHRTSFSIFQLQLFFQLTCSTVDDGCDSSSPNNWNEIFQKGKLNIFLSFFFGLIVSADVVTRLNFGTVSDGIDEENSMMLERKTLSYHHFK